MSPFTPTALHIFKVTFSIGFVHASSDTGKSLFLGRPDDQAKREAGGAVLETPPADTPLEI